MLYDTLRSWSWSQVPRYYTTGLMFISIWRFKWIQEIRSKLNSKLFGAILKLIKFSWNLKLRLREDLIKKTSETSCSHYLHRILKDFVLHQMKLTDYVLPLQISIFSLAPLLVQRVPSLFPLSPHRSLDLYIIFPHKVCKTRTLAVLSLCLSNLKT